MDVRPWASNPHDVPVCDDYDGAPRDSDSNAPWPHNTIDKPCHGCHVAQGIVEECECNRCYNAWLDSTDPDLRTPESFKEKEL